MTVYLTLTLVLYIISKKKLNALSNGWKTQIKYSIRGFLQVGFQKKRVEQVNFTLSNAIEISYNLPHYFAEHLDHVSGEYHV